MSAVESHCSRRLALALFLVAAIVPGCGVAPLDDGKSILPDLTPGIEDPDEWDAPSQPGPLPHATAPFEGAIALDLDDADALTVTGNVRNPGDVTIYDIGSVLRGDRLEIEVTALTEGFDPAAAVFDVYENSMHINDDRHYYNRELEPKLDFVVRQRSEFCYVAVTSSPRSDSSGRFRLSVKRTSQAAVSAANAAIVYLEFRGANQVAIGRRTPVDVPPFAGSMIGPEFKNDTAALIRETVARVRADYAGYDVTILSSAEQTPPGQPHTTVYFGSYNPALLGIADSVDSFNQRQIQEAIIFVDTFSIFMSQDPTVEEMANALANVASHEIGHLLGLNHTADVEGIMDTTANLRQMLARQYFRRSPLNSDTFGVGFQNAPNLLLQNVGGDVAVIQAAQRTLRAIERDPWYDGGPQAPVRTLLTFGTACEGH